MPIVPMVAQPRDSNRGERRMRGGIYPIKMIERLALEAGIMELQLGTGSHTMFDEWLNEHRQLGCEVE